MFFDLSPTKISLKIYKMYGSNIQVGPIFLFIQTVQLIKDTGQRFFWTQGFVSGRRKGSMDRNEITNRALNYK